jgi:hypothetical protein
MRARPTTTRSAALSGGATASGSIASAMIARLSRQPDSSVGGQLWLRARVPRLSGIRIRRDR